MLVCGQIKIFKLLLEFHIQIGIYLNMKCKYCYQDMTTRIVATRLVAVGQTAHAAHDTQHVVVGRIHAHRGARVGAHRVIAYS